MITTEDVRQSYQDYLEENNLAECDYSFMEFLHDNYNHEHIIGL